MIRLQEFLRRRRPLRWRTCSTALAIFFFSSRRRHTRYIGDWSSDVCSSDLDAIGKATLAPRIDDLSRAALALLPVLHEVYGIRHVDTATILQWLWGFVCHLRQRGAVIHPERSEERRVGKECISRCAA